MSLGKKVTLASGHAIPQLGYGTWQAAPGEVGDGVLEALKAGYRHLDLALVYGNQKEVATGLQRALGEIAGLRREDVFITSKLWNHQHHPARVASALDECLAQLQLDYLDLYLVHWPVAFPDKGVLFPRTADDAEVELDLGVTLSQTWEAMTKLPKTKVRSVGVSNFTQDHIETIIHDTGVVPAVLQIERHPRLPQPELVQYCKDKGIHITAYSAFGNNMKNIPLIIASDEVKHVAQRLSTARGQPVTAAQVVLAWSQLGGHSVIPKSVTASRIRENFHEVELDDQDIAVLDALGQTTTTRFNVPFTYTPRWNVNIWNDEAERNATSTPVTKLL